MSSMSERYVWYLLQCTQDNKQVTLFTCVQCGATVSEVNASTITRELHDQWHQS